MRRLDGGCVCVELDGAILVNAVRETTEKCVHISTYRCQCHLRPFSHAKDICYMPGNVDLDPLVAHLQLLGHVLDDTDVTLSTVSCGISAAVMGMFLRIGFDDVDGHQVAGLDIVTDQVEVEKDLIAGERLVDSDGVSALCTRPPRGRAIANC